MKNRVFKYILELNIFLMFLLFNIINLLTIKIFSKNLEDFFCKKISKILYNKKNYFELNNEFKIKEDIYPLQ